MQAIFAIVFFALLATAMAQYASSYYGAYPAATYSTAYGAGAGYYGAGLARPGVYGAYGGYGAYSPYRYL